MSNTTDQPQQPLWLRIINNQRFKALLMTAISASGVASMAIIQKWFPGLQPSDVVNDLIQAAPFVVTGFVEWYRNHPDNILARARKVINGGTASDHAVAATAVTAQIAAQK